MANYMVQAQQKWTVTAVTNAGGYPGSPYFKITIAGTDRALAATADGELVALPAFTGAPEQLWRLDQLTDGTWRIMPKSTQFQGSAGHLRHRQQFGDAGQIQSATATSNAGCSRRREHRSKPLESILKSKIQPSALYDLRFATS